jgi:hypothetical protein
MFYFDVAYGYNDFQVFQLSSDYFLRPIESVVFLLLDFLFDHSTYSKFCINIIYFVLTYFIIRDTLVMIY